MQKFHTMALQTLIPYLIVHDNTLLIPIIVFERRRWYQKNCEVHFFPLFWRLCDQTLESTKAESFLCQTTNLFCPIKSWSAGCDVRYARAGGRNWVASNLGSHFHQFGSVGWSRASSQWGSDAARAAFWPAHYLCRQPGLGDCVCVWILRPKH